MSIQSNLFSLRRCADLVRQVQSSGLSLWIRVFPAKTGQRLSWYIMRAHAWLCSNRWFVCTRWWKIQLICENNDSTIFRFTEDELISKHCRGWICPRMQKCVVRIVGSCKGFNCIIERSCRPSNVFSNSSTKHDDNKVIYSLSDIVKFIVNSEEKKKQFCRSYFVTL